jgi:hypothetical protein
MIPDLRLPLAAFVLALGQTALAHDGTLASLRGTFTFEGNEVRGACDIYSDKVLVKIQTGQGHATHLKIKSLDVIATDLIASPMAAAKAVALAAEEPVQIITSNHLNHSYVAFLENPAADPDVQEIDILRGTAVRNGPAAKALREWIELNCQGRAARKAGNAGDSRLADYEATYVGPGGNTKSLWCRIFPDRVKRQRLVDGKLSGVETLPAIYKPLQGPQAFNDAYQRAKGDWLRRVPLGSSGNSYSLTAYGDGGTGVRSGLLILEPGVRRQSPDAFDIERFAKENCHQ